MQIMGNLPEELMNKVASRKIKNQLKEAQADPKLERTSLDALLLDYDAKAV